ncbi:MAG TPA: phosphatase RsbU N-terminal domain-containing protein, partial [Bacillota bacterium]|nr:phosphatase RsbU N-terminal domain-containing protein [Bacillota bacterium]
MSITAAELTRQYAVALHDYLRGGDEAGLQHAYELGRQTIAAELGVMDLVRAHQEALAALWSEKTTDYLRTWQLAGAFFT